MDRLQQFTSGWQTSLFFAVWMRDSRRDGECSVPRWGFLRLFVVNSKSQAIFILSEHQRTSIMCNPKYGWCICKTVCLRSRSSGNLRREPMGGIMLRRSFATLVCICVFLDKRTSSGRQSHSPVVGLFVSFSPYKFSAEQSHQER